MRLEPMIESQALKEVEVLLRSLLRSLLLGRSLLGNLGYLLDGFLGDFLNSFLCSFFGNGHVYSPRDIGCFCPTTQALHS
jgi:hypothetical protein